MLERKTNRDLFKDFFIEVNQDLLESQVISESQVANLASIDVDHSLDHEVSALEAIANLVVASSEDKK